MKRIIALVLAGIMLIVFINPVLAQSETEPIPEVEQEQEKLNPVIQWIADFFKDLFTVETPEIPEETPEPDGTPEGDGSEDPDGIIPTEEPTLTPEEQIALYHDEDDLGFGVMVKLLSIAEAAKEECSTSGLNCDVDIDSLIEQFKSGISIGDLSEIYGKPDALGVGHVKDGKSQNQNKVKNENMNKKEK